MRVPDFQARNRAINDLGLTADVNADSFQLQELSRHLNTLPPVGVTFYDVTSPGYDPARSTLLGLNTTTYPLHTQVVVEFGPNGEYIERWQLIYDAQGPRQALLDYGGPALPVRWERVTDKRSGVPSYDELQLRAPAGGYVFAERDLMRDYAGGPVEKFFAALLDGPLPRPTDPEGDANWRRVGDEEVPEPEPFDFVLALSAAQSAAVAGQVKPNRQYRIRGGDVATGRDVLTHGLSRYGYEPQAYRAVPDQSTGRETYEAGTYAVATGVFTPAVDIAAELALKAPLASPIFVDFPRAPTPAIDSNISGELLATIDFVRRSFSDTTAFLARKPTGQVTNNVSSLNAAYSFAANGLVILNRPVKSGFVFTGSATLDCQGYSINFDGADINIYDGAKIINNKLLLKARLFCRPSPNAIITIEGGVFSGQIFFFEQSATVIFDGCDVVDFGAGIGSGGFCSTPGGKIILRNGAQLLQPADPSTVVEVEPVAPGGTGPATITNDSITEPKLAPAVRAKLNALAATTNFLQIRSVPGVRVCEIPVLSPVSVLEEILDKNVLGVEYQLDKSTRSGTHEYGTSGIARAQLLPLLAALTAADYTAGVKLYARTVVTSPPDPATLILKFEYA